MSSSFSPGISLSHMDVCHRLKLQSLTTLLYEIMHDSYRGEFGKQTGEKLGTKLALNKLLQTPDNIAYWNEEFTTKEWMLQRKTEIKGGSCKRGREDWWK